MIAITFDITKTGFDIPETWNALKKLKMWRQRKETKLLTRSA
jgi:hypothetical protein